MSSALSVTCQFYVFYFILTIGHTGPAHHALSWCMLYLTDRGMCNLDIYTGQPSFCLVFFSDLHIWISQFYLVLMLTALYSVYLFYFILPTRQNDIMHFAITCYVLFQDHFV